MGEPARQMTGPRRPYATATLTPRQALWSAHPPTRTLAERADSLCAVWGLVFSTSSLSACCGARHLLRRAPGSRHGQVTEHHCAHLLRVVMKVAAFQT